MRTDLHKVIVERPRWGHSLPSRKTAWSTASYDPERHDDLPARESMSASWNVPCKEFRDRLGPLKRFLGAHVGRPWRDVESEFRQALDLSTLMGRHLWDHALSMVERDCRLTKDGFILGLRGYSHRPFHVDPRSGRLLRSVPERIDEAAARRRRVDQAREVRLDARTRAEQIAGLWYLWAETGRFRQIVEILDVPGGRKYPQVRVVPELRKKQANKKEIARIREAIEREVR